MLIGTNKHVGTYYRFSNALLSRVLDEVTLRHALVKSTWWQGVGNDTQAELAITAYRAVHPESLPGDSFFGIASDLVRDDAIMQAERKSALAKAAVFMYQFAWESPAFDGKYGSCHAFELPFVFDNVAAAPQLWGHNPDRRRHELATTMSKAWAAFAHTGNPSHSGLPRWNSYTVSERATMVLNYSSELIRDPQRDDRLAFEALRSSRLPAVTTVSPP